MEAIISLSGRGLDYEAAAILSGIQKETARRWRAIGEADRNDEEARGPYERFWSRVEQAGAECRIEMLLRVRHAASSDGRAAAWILERTNFGRYGPGSGAKLARWRATEEKRERGEMAIADMSAAEDPDPSEQDPDITWGLRPGSTRDF